MVAASLELNEESGDRNERSGFRDEQLDAMLAANLRVAAEGQKHRGVVSGGFEGDDIADIVVGSTVTGGFHWGEHDEDYDG